MRIGIDADPIGRNRSGNETYLRGIILGLQRVLPESDELVLAGSNAAALGELCDTRTTVVPIPAGLAGDVVLGRRLRNAGADVALASYNAPVGFGRPVATIVHDVSYIRHSDTFPAALAWRLKLLTPITLRRSRLLVTVSEFSRHELLDVYPWLDPDKIVVTPNAPSERLFDEPAPTELERVRAEYQLPDAFVLTVGNLQPRKNLPRLADATVALDLPLIVCGQSGWEQQKVSPALSASSVRWLGYVPDGDLSVLYRLCTLMAYPSLYEGFGLPVIEAMAAGAPVVTSNSSALEEVAAGCAELVDPTDVKSIKSGLERVWSSPSRQTELRQLGRARAVEFTWARSATVLIDRLRAVV